ncbi:hypothetical protein FQN57_002013 [Myotisia sp. PD_48]|nr:hypothetical protein FQN57_002013 [Myotisia sp. PD_48]
MMTGNNIEGSSHMTKSLTRTIVVSSRRKWFRGFSPLNHKYIVLKSNISDHSLGRIKWDNADLVGLEIKQDQRIGQRFGLVYQHPVIIKRSRFAIRQMKISAGHSIKNSSELISQWIGDIAAVVQKLGFARTREEQFNAKRKKFWLREGRKPGFRNSTAPNHIGSVHEQ